MDGEFITPVPDHPTQDVQHSETYVHVSKQSLKRNAAQTDHPTKRLVAQAVSGMNFEKRSKLNCQIRSLGKIARQSRRITHNYLISPRTLEELSLPADYTHSSSGETLLLWDSSYTTELRRSFLFGTPTNTRTLLEAGHLIIDGTFKSAPQLFTFEKLQMIIQKFDSYPTILDFLKCTSCLM